MPSYTLRYCKKKCREVVIVIIPVGPPSERVGERSMREDTKTQIICISVTDIKSNIDDGSN